MEMSNRTNSTYPPKLISIWIVVSLSILFTGVTVLGVIVISDNNENKLDAYSATKFIKEDPVLHNRRRLRSTKNKVRRRRISEKDDQMQPFVLKDHRSDSQHLQEILYFLNHL